MDKLDMVFKKALEARNNAYAPYSGFKVGAALAVKGMDRLFSGCNVENASYGGTICAERTAIVSSIAVLGKVDLEFCVVVTDSVPPSPPCALCLQVFSEFCDPDFPIYLATLKGIEKKFFLRDLLPVPFNKIPD